MSTTDPTASHGHLPQMPGVLLVTIYHNHEARFMPYEDGQQLTAVTGHWIYALAGDDPLAVADWAYRTFNADLDMLEADRETPDGETTFLAACVYRLLGHRSLSVGDVIHIQTGHDPRWLACDPFGWRTITEPTNRSSESLSAATVYRHLADQRAANRGAGPTEARHVSAAEQAFASLTALRRTRLLRGVFEILEYDPDGEPGGEWSSDTTQALGDLFAHFGITFTSPDQVDTEPELPAQNPGREVTQMESHRIGGVTTPPGAMTDDTTGEPGRSSRTYTMTTQITVHADADLRDPFARFAVLRALAEQLTGVQWELQTTHGAATAHIGPVTAVS